jgi:hypothetical protein
MRARLMLLAINLAVFAAIAGAFSRRSWSDGNGW